MGGAMQLIKDVILAIVVIIFLFAFFGSDLWACDMRDIDDDYIFISAPEAL